MSVAGAMLAGYRQSLKAMMLTASCTRKSAAANWADAVSCRCLVEEASPQTAAALDYEAGNGYAYSVYVPHDQAMATTDQIVCSLGTIEVVRVTPIGTLDGVRRADGVLR